MRYSGGVTVWWDLSCNQFHSLCALGQLSKILMSRLDEKTLRVYVGEFCKPCTLGEIRAALVAHSLGRLTVA